MPDSRSHISKPFYPERASQSLIKPHLLHLSGSGLWLNGAIIERDVEQPHVEYDPSSGDGAPAQSAELIQSPKHVLVLPSGAPARLEWRIGREREQARFSTKDAILNPAGLFAAPRWESEVELLLFAVNPALVSQVAEEMGRSGRVELVPRFHFQDELLRPLARRLLAEFEQDVPPDRVYAESLTHTLVAHLIRTYSVEGAADAPTGRRLSARALRRVTNYINDRLSEDLSLDAIAEVAGYSSSHFITLFKGSTGQTPHQYVIARRIERAKALLARTNKPIADIAFQTGFADQSHLTRLMRRHTGLTPGVVRDG